MNYTAITPYISPLKEQGGTFFTFGSALEDISLNINKSSMKVDISRFALLKIPVCKPTSYDKNYFNCTLTYGMFDIYDTQTASKDSRSVIAESFQNYALNLETSIVNDNGYDPSSYTTVSEKVFWKWLKESGAIRWEPKNNKLVEEAESDTYERVVKCIGNITTGSIRTTGFNTFNETYILVPTSFGSYEQYFDYNTTDSNYVLGKTYSSNTTSYLLGRDETSVHPYGLSTKAFCDFISTKNLTIGSSKKLKISSNNTTWTDGWWWGSLSDTGYCYRTDAVVSSTYNDYLGIFEGSNTSPKYRIKRSRYDAVTLNSDLTSLNSLNSTSYTNLDEFAKNSTNNFEFNTVLVYYSIYDNNDQEVAVNLLGVLFLDKSVNGIGSSTGANIEFDIPSLVKNASSAVNKIGNAYSFKINFKVNSLLDSSEFTIADSSTSSQDIISDFSNVLSNLNKSILLLSNLNKTNANILNQYTALNNSYQDLLERVVKIENKIS